jgi:hypothetical protein
MTDSLHADYRFRKTATIGGNVTYDRRLINGADANANSGFFLIEDFDVIALEIQSSNTATITIYVANSQVMPVTGSGGALWDTLTATGTSLIIGNWRWMEVRVAWTSGIVTVDAKATMRKS